MYYYSVHWSFIYFIFFSSAESHTHYATETKIPAPCCLHVFCRMPLAHKYTIPITFTIKAILYSAVDKQHKKSNLASLQTRNKKIIYWKV